MLFDGKLKNAQDRIAQLTALLGVAGFNAEGDALPTAEEFGATLNAKQASAVQAALAPVQEQLAAATLRGDVYASALAGANVRVGDLTAADFAPGEGNTASKAETAILSAINTRIAANAAKQIAAAGHGAALEIPAGNQSAADASSADETPATAEDFLRAHAAITDPGARTAYFRKHAHRFPVR